MYGVYILYSFGLKFTILTTPTTAVTHEHSTGLAAYRSSKRLMKHQHEDECNGQRDSSWWDDTFTSTVSAINQLGKASSGCRVTTALVSLSVSIINKIATPYTRKNEWIKLDLSYVCYCSGYRRGTCRDCLASEILRPSTSLRAYCTCRT